MEISGDDIADVVLKQFDSWEKKRKPIIRTNGVREWVPLSGIVAEGTNGFTCLAAATGMKCLPQKSVPQAQGVVLHDWHAEVLAIRSFNRFLLEECHSLALSKKISSEYLRIRDEHERTESHFQPFALKEGIKLHMYCSEAPCGDASMELTMASQDDATPWSLPPSTDALSPSTPQVPASAPEPVLHGRSYFSALGIVRRKPSRPDAPPTLSKSCTDKLALTQSTSLLSSLSSLLISPTNIYIHTLVLPSSQLSSTAVTRAFSPSGRLAPLLGKQWAGGYAFNPFRVLSTEMEFPFSRRSAADVVPSSIASSWTPNGSETLIGGTLQGRKQFDVRGASRVCKRRMWKLALEVAVVACVPAVERCLRVEKYGDVKESVLLDRRTVKGDVRAVLGGWVRNGGGEGFGVEGVEV
ncbi:tRNA-specific adenosine deaminase 1 [Lachnellula cervina]|uniref:tRNA-specific adenosine deaminase 1 n=1 Tax=Lachnellula cervina TaxID=1316786 RepID=A0A7D8YP20_9HELO|nr:tRNA-specific adenosine deaminase 1 [Lachnellula cervina]